MKKAKSRRELLTRAAAFLVGAPALKSAADTFPREDLPIKPANLDMRTPSEQQYELFQAAIRAESFDDLVAAEAKWSQLINAFEAGDGFVRAESSAVVLARAYSGRSRVRTSLGKFSPALVDISSAVDLQPDVADFWVQRGETFEHASRAQQRLGQVLKARQFSEAALQNYDHGIMLRPADCTLLERSADVMVDLKQYGPATQQYFRALELAPQDGALAAKFALSIVQAGDIATATQILGEVMNGLPESPEVVMACACIAWQVGSLAEGLSLLQRAMAKDRRLHSPEYIAEELRWPPIAQTYYSNLVSRRIGDETFDAIVGGAYNNGPYNNIL